MTNFNTPYQIFLPNINKKKPKFYTCLEIRTSNKLKFDTLYFKNNTTTKI